MREPRQLIEECKKHLRDTEQYKHEYKKDIRKLITALEKQLALSGVSKSVVCGNCDGWGYTVDENGRRKDHCNECE